MTTQKVFQTHTTNIRTHFYMYVRECMNGFFCNFNTTKCKCLTMKIQFHFFPFAISFLLSVVCEDERKDNKNKLNILFLFSLAEARENPKITVIK